MGIRTWCLALAAWPLLAQVPCERLAALRLKDTTITAAERVTLLPGRPVVAHCRVAFTLRPTADSEIEVELRLPDAASWNGKFLGVGGGGWVGSINVAGILNGVDLGYASASTDTGHVGQNAAFTLGHPEKVVDFAYRAVHVMTVSAKEILREHYGRPAKLSYWTGCSTGGRQGLMEAVRYPGDYDGIVAGAPANNQIELCGWRMALEVTALMDPSRSVSPQKLATLQEAVTRACDGLDGVKDGLLADPRRCRFDPGTLLCRGASTDDCLTAAEIESMRRGYAPVMKKSGEMIYPGLVPGNETGWQLLAGGRSEPNSLDGGMFRYVAHQDANWDWRSFDVERDVALAQQRAGFIEVEEPDLSAFRKRGGKLLIYHGWSDGGSGGAISPLNTIHYYERILQKMGPKQGDWLRLFLVPGMGHCGGGPGTDQFNALAALERWRELSLAPDQIPAAHVNENRRVTMTRPLCPYPLAATYRGIGSTNDAGNFVCR